MTAAMPTLPPMFRIRLKIPAAFPIFSRCSRPMVMVVRGTKMKPVAKPLIRFGMATETMEILRFTRLNRNTE